MCLRSIRDGEGDTIDPSEGDPPGDLTLIHLPHRKGTAPDRGSRPPSLSWPTVTERTPPTQRRKARYGTRGTAMASPVSGRWCLIQSPRVKTREARHGAGHAKLRLRSGRRSQRCHAPGDEKSVRHKHRGLRGDQVQVSGRGWTHPHQSGLRSRGDPHRNPTVDGA